jgi:hypothetical protein
MVEIIHVTSNKVASKGCGWNLLKQFVLMLFEGLQLTSIPNWVSNDRNSAWSSTLRTSLKSIASDLNTDLHSIYQEKGLIKYVEFEDLETDSGPFGEQLKDFRFRLWNRDFDVIMCTWIRSVPLLLVLSVRAVGRVVTAFVDERNNRFFGWTTSGEFFGAKKRTFCLWDQRLVSLF